jgi:Flp pilus assembly protein TadG
MTRGRGEDGLTATQLAVIMPALLLWIMLIVQYGLWFHAKQVAGAAAAEAVDAGQLATATTADGERAALSFLAQSGNLDQIAVDVQRTDDAVTVRVSGRAPRLVPFTNWGVTAIAEARVEQFIPQAER